MNKLPNPTPEELEMCANYVLWGKEPDGKSIVQKKFVEIETRKKTWTKTPPESLDGLLEDPSFSENLIYHRGEPGTRIPSPRFNREKELARAPKNLIPIFKDLFKEIDQLDYITSFAGLSHQKRKAPIREELINRFTPKERASLEEQANHLTPFKLLKFRHLLVELRQQQYALKDLYAPLLQKDVESLLPRLNPEIDLTFDADIKVFPLGIIGQTEVSQLLFKPNPNPKDFTEKELKLISDFIWEKDKEKEATIGTKKFYFDFENPTHIYKFFSIFELLGDEALKGRTHSTTQDFISTFHFYAERAKLRPEQREILKLKLEGASNAEIGKTIRTNFKKGYSDNYISTIFTKNIIPAISFAAAEHRRIVGNYFFPENFKNCCVCGALLLNDPVYFSRKSYASGGLAARCKVCESKRRKELSEEKKKKIQLNSKED